MDSFTAPYIVPHNQPSLHQVAASLTLSTAEKLESTKTITRTDREQKPILTKTHPKRKGLVINLTSIFLNQIKCECLNFITMNIGSMVLFLPLELLCQLFHPLLDVWRSLDTQCLLQEVRQTCCLVACDPILEE